MGKSEPGHKFDTYSIITYNEGSGDPAQIGATHKSLRCLHTLSRNVDEDLDEHLDH